MSTDIGLWSAAVLPARGTSGSISMALNSTVKSTSRSEAIRGTLVLRKSVLSEFPHPSHVQGTLFIVRLILDMTLPVISPFVPFESLSKAELLPAHPGCEDTRQVDDTVVLQPCRHRNGEALRMSLVSRSCLRG